MTSTLRICGCPFSATQPTSILHVWRFMRPAMLGDLSVGRFIRYGGSECEIGFLIGASMTLVGLLPPLCDNGSMLVDGGYEIAPLTLSVDNLPCGGDRSNLSYTYYSCSRVALVTNELLYITYKSRRRVYGRIGSVNVSVG